MNETNGSKSLAFGRRPENNIGKPMVSRGHRRIARKNGRIFCRYPMVKRSLILDGPTAHDPIAQPNGLGINTIYPAPQRGAISSRDPSGRFDPMTQPRPLAWAKELRPFRASAHPFTFPEQILGPRSADPRRLNLPENATVTFGSINGRYC